MDTKKLDQYRASRAGLKEVTIGTPSSKKVDPPSRKTAIEIEAFKKRIRSEEGKGKKDRPGYLYRDTRGYKTIGYGHKITPRDSIELPKLLGKGFDTVGVLSGRVPLTDKQMDFVLSKDVGEKLDTSKRLFPKYDSYSHELKEAILDGVYRGDLSDSPNTIRLINEGKFTLASKEYINHEGYRRSKRGEKGYGSGIYKRMDRNAAIMKAEQFRKK